MLKNPENVSWSLFLAEYKKIYHQLGASMSDDVNLKML